MLPSHVTHELPRQRHERDWRDDHAGETETGRGTETETETEWIDDVRDRYREAEWT